MTEGLERGGHAGPFLSETRRETGQRGTHRGHQAGQGRVAARKGAVLGFLRRRGLRKTELGWLVSGERKPCRQYAMCRRSETSIRQDGGLGVNKRACSPSLD